MKRTEIDLILAAESLRLTRQEEWLLKRNRGMSDLMQVDFAASQSTINRLRRKLLG
jgi:hypothetical protein